MKKQFSSKGGVQKKENCAKLMKIISTFCESFWGIESEMVKLLEVSNNVYNKYNHYQESLIPGSLQLWLWVLCFEIRELAIFRLLIYKQWQVQ